MEDRSFMYETQGAITYLVYTIQTEDVIDTLGLGMLTNNKIAGLAATLYTQMDAERFIKFNVTAKIPARQLFHGPVNRKRLVGVFKGITSALTSADEYMIDPASILLDLDHIYTDVSTFKTVLICLPVKREQDVADLGQFFKEIMFSTQFDPSENCDYVAKIMNYLNSSPSFSVYEFDKLLEQLGGENTAQSPSADQVSTQPVQAAPSQQKAQPVQPQAVQAQPSVPQMGALSGNHAPTSAPSAQRESSNTSGQPSAKTTAQVQPYQAQQPQGNAAQPEANEKPMSYMSLLMHYNKENAALYKAQKAAKKKAEAEARSKSAKKDKKEKPTPPAAFAIPGQQPVMPVSSTQSAVPGRGGANPLLPQDPASSSPDPTPAKPQAQVPQVAKTVAVPQAATAVAPQQMQVSPNMSFGETTVLGGNGIGETTVLGEGVQNVQMRPHMIRAKNNERIDINKPVFRIGTERSYVDYFISDNAAVSRSHANIISKDGEYFIVDTNSTNHTYINGGMIMSNTETRLPHGTRIRLANEEFEFRLY